LAYLDGSSGNESDFATKRFDVRRNTLWMPTQFLGVPRRLLTVAALAIAIALLAMALITPSGDAQARQRARGAAVGAARPVAAAPAAVRQAAVKPATPVGLALRLQSLLGHHSILVADMMRSRLRGDPDFAQAADNALGKNTEELAQIVKVLFGDEAEKAFIPQWSTHVSALFNYSRGLADKDQAVMKQARDALTAYEKDLAALFAEASGGKVPAKVAQDALTMHVQHMVQQANAFAAGDYDKAAAINRVAYAHTFALGAGMARGLLSAKDIAVLDQPKVRLEAEFARLFGEHVALVVSAQRAGVVDAPDFAAAAKAMDGNSKDLTLAVDALYGAPAAAKFEQLWAKRIEGLMAYTAAIAADDAAAKAQVVSALKSFEPSFVEFLTSATNKRLPSDWAAKALGQQNAMLAKHVDQFAAKDYSAAHQTAYATFTHVVDVAGKIADATGNTIASRLPQGGAQTGGGGMASVVGRR
jgi:hypothetical protein